MSKAFLSHSGQDKHLVEFVFKELNAANVHYDAVTFETGTTSAQNIVDAMGDTDLFVLFVSKHSLKSEWVRAEIKLARKFHRQERLKSLLIFIIDDTPYSSLPEWIKTFTATRLKFPKLIGLKIISRLMELDLDNGLRCDVFVGRNDVRGDIKSALSAAVEQTPVGICVSGWHGIGRRTVLRKALSETFSWLPQLLPEIHLRDVDGPSEFYRGLLDLLAPRSPEEWEKILGVFRDADEQGQIKLITEAMTKLSQLRQVIILKGDLSLVAENGDLQPWLNKLVFALPRQNIPFFCMVCSRRVPPRLQALYRRLAFFALKSLSLTESKELLSVLLKFDTAPVSAQFLNLITPIASGHPQNIRIVAEFARRLGAEAFANRRQEFASLFTERANRLIELVLDHNSTQDDGREITRVKKIVLKLFSDYEYLSPDEILSFFNSPDAALVQRVLYELEDFGVIEWEGRFFRLAPFVFDAVGFASWDKETSEVRKRAAQEIIQRSARYVDEEGVRLSVIDRATLVLLRNVAAGDHKISVTHSWLQNAALPSHYLRVAREVYDERKELAAIELIEKVLSFDRGLTVQARIEALRLKGMCHARLNQTDELYTVVRGLEQIGTRVARRNAWFLKGFKARKGGRYEDAEHAYRSAYKLDIRHFHVLRELSHVLLLQDKFEEAIMIAEAAVERHPSNSYALDTLVGAKIGHMEKNGGKQDSEIEELFERLEEACAFDKTSFFDIRKAYYLASHGNYPDAISHAKAAIARTPNLFAAIAVNANVYLMARDAKKAGAAIKDLERMVADERTGEGKDRNQLAKLKVRYALLRGDSAAAKVELERAQISRNIRTILDTEIAAFESRARPSRSTNRQSSTQNHHHSVPKPSHSTSTDPRVSITKKEKPRPQFSAPQFGKRGPRNGS